MLLKSLLKYPHQCHHPSQSCDPSRYLLIEKHNYVVSEKLEPVESPAPKKRKRKVTKTPIACITNMRTENRAESLEPEQILYLNAIVVF